MTSILGEESFGLEHIITEGNDMTGVLPQKAYANELTVLGGTQDETTPSVEVARGTHTVTRPDSDGTPTELGVTLVDGNGLFDPYTVFSQLRGKHIWITSIEVRYSDGGGGKTWTCAMTSGLDDGDAATFVDAIGYDVELRAGTGNTIEKLGYEMLPGRKVRVIADNPGAGEALRVAVLFTLVNGPSGRLV